MNKKVLLATVVLIVVISIPAVIAALQQSQSIHVSKTYTAPIPTPTPNSSANPTATPTANSPTVAFSLFFPNGTAYVMNQDNAGSIYGATNLDTNGIPVNVQTSLGAPPTGYVAGVIVVRNDGSVPITLNAALANINVPSDISLSLTSTTINPSTWGNQLNGWMGANNLATGSTVGVGQYVWLSVSVLMTSNTVGTSGVIRNHETFSYSFDVVVTATQA
ncbi:MAG: hypothetical protein NWE98_04335 [Candidatus Bathyarchaeota archaeon]|nr:hypothetical protein [Candidatus Bathyarchaeota archaeon]